MATILLVIAAFGLTLSVLSMVGVELGSIDFDIGDTGVGFLSLFTPLVTMATGVIGLSMILDVPFLLGLIAGGFCSIVTVAILFPVLRALNKAGVESVSSEYQGVQARIIETVRPGSVGSAEVKTLNGHDILTVKSDQQINSGDIAYITHTSGNEIWYITKFENKELEN